MRPAVLLLELDCLASARRLNRLYPVLVQGRHEVAIEIGDASVEEVLAECLAGGVGVKRSRVVHEGQKRDQNRQSPDR
jgi:hypothetical protein